MLRLIKDFLNDGKHSAVLNGQCSSWIDVQAGVPQGSILGPFLIYINDLPDNLASNPKLISDDTPLFSIVTDAAATANQINNYLHNINTWSHQWKMNFNLDISKQAQEVIFSHKVKVTAYLQLAFDNNPVYEASTQKHLGMFLDFKLNFQEHFQNMFIKVNKT